MLTIKIITKYGDLREQPRQTRTSVYSCLSYEKYEHDSKFSITFCSGGSVGLDILKKVENPQSVGAIASVSVYIENMDGKTIDSIQGFILADEQ